MPPEEAERTILLYLNGQSVIIKAGDTMGIILDLLEGLSKVSENEEKRKQEELEKEMDLYNLEEWQKELVREGRYNPWSFTKEDGELLEEGDYYYEDDR
jgi:hypothetical protein